MKDFKFLHQVQDSLQTLHGYSAPFSVTDFLVPSKDTDQLIVKEAGDDSEVMVFIRESLLNEFSDKNFPEDFHLGILPNLSVVIEELSHFNTYCLSAIQEREISQVELEVQGEVDKFGVALEFLEKKNEQDLREKAFEVLFDQFKLGDWVRAEDESRYLDAHEIARNFCRRILEKSPSADERRSEFREFFSRSRAAKLSVKY